jgi:hypothetical protein
MLLEIQLDHLRFKVTSERSWKSQFTLLATLGITTILAGVPLRIDPTNPHYLEFRGRTAVLVGASEHYGAVLNRGFDFIPYLDVLGADDLNVVRIFAGAYRELPGRFTPLFDLEIVRNTLAPDFTHFLAPWPRSAVPGAADGGAKFDLRKWDEAYFSRLRKFVAAAGERGIVVEVSLFSVYYGDNLWHVSPLYAKNNVNNVGNVSREEVFLNRDPGLRAVQARLARHVAETLRDFDNLYYEICNEPSEGNVPMEWQKEMISAIKSGDAGASHLIAQEVGYGSGRITQRMPEVSVFLFHGTRTTQSLTENSDLGMPIGSNEDGFDGQSSAPYRLEAWQYLLSGGALYMNLDYSFTVDSPQGGFIMPRTQPGGGSAQLRRQLGILRKFINGFDIGRMRPLPSVVRWGGNESGVASVLGDEGKAYAVYLHRGKPFDTELAQLNVPHFVIDETLHSADCAIALPPGHYEMKWFDPKTGRYIKTEAREAGNEATSLISPEFREDIALAIRAK